MTTPIWLQTLKNSTDAATNGVAALLESPDYARTFDQIQRSPTLQQDIVEFTTGTGRFDGRGPGKFTTAGVDLGAGQYRASTNTVEMGLNRLRGLDKDGNVDLYADGGPVIAHEIQHAFNRADINGLPAFADPGFPNSHSTKVVWNNLLDEAEAVLHQYVAAKEIYERELLNYQIDPSQARPTLTVGGGTIPHPDDRDSAGNLVPLISTVSYQIAQWLTDGAEQYRHGLTPSPDYIARANLGAHIGNNFIPSGSTSKNYVDYYANSGMGSASDAQRMQHVQITGIENGLLSVVFTSEGNNPSAYITFSEPISAGAEGAWNSQIGHPIPVGGAPGGMVPAKMIDGRAVMIVETVSSDGQGNTMVTDYQTGQVTLTLYNAADAVAGTITDTPDGAGGINRIVSTMVDGKLIEITQHVDAAKAGVDSDLDGNMVDAGDAETTDLTIGGEVAVNSDLIENALDATYVSAIDIIRARETGDLRQSMAAGDPASETGIYTVNPTPGVPWYDIAEVRRLGDVLTSTQALVAALKTGNNLTIATSLSNLHDTVAGTGTSGVGIGLNGLSDFLGLRDALQRGDGLRVIHSGLSFSVDALKAYQYMLDFQATALLDKLALAEVTPGVLSAADEAAAEALYNSLSSELAWASDLIQGIGEALPYIGVLLKIDEGKYLEAAALLYAAIYNIPWIGWAIAIGSLLDSEPDTVPRGIATLSANGPDGLGIEIALTGNNFGGSEVVHKLMVELMSHLNPVVDKLEGKGLVAERMPVLHFNGGIFTLAMTDPHTGAKSEREFNASGGLIGETLNGNWVEIAGGDNYYKNIVGQFVDFATTTPGLIVPDWELQTIYRQHQLQIAQAGMTTMARAKVDNTLMTTEPGAVQSVRPIILNFGDDGTAVSDPVQGGTVQFDVDSDGFAEATNWINPRDGMLVLDRDGDGRIVTGHELFSDAGVNMATRGLNVLREIDSDGDDMLTTFDPVFTHLQVWIDLNMSGHVEVMDDGSTPELHSLASLGITEIDFNQYRGPNFVMDGNSHALTQVTLSATTQGVLAMVSDAGQWTLNEGGGEALLPTAKDESQATVPGPHTGQSSDATLVAGYDSMKTLEDKTLSISMDLLLSNDHTTATGLVDASLRVTAVTVDAVGAGSVSLDAAKGLVLFTPAANFYGKSGFSYTVSDGQGQTATAHVDVDIASVNDDPIAYNALGDAHLYANEEFGNFQLQLGAGVSATGIMVVNERVFVGGEDGTWYGGVKIGATFYSLGHKNGPGGVELYAGELTDTGTVWHPIFKTDPYVYSGTVVGSDVEDGTNLVFEILHQRKDLGIADINPITGAWTFTYIHHDPVSGVVTNEADAAFIVRVTDQNDPAGFYDVEIVVGGRALDRTIFTGGDAGTVTPADPDWGNRRDEGVGGRGTGAGAPNKIAFGGARAAMAATIAPPRQEPLALDMDGDGIETNSNLDGTQILFDHNGDGIKIGTGWLRPDDAWLVLDLNGNGTIDSGRELFGVDTILKNGTLAPDGFSALRDQDSNADGLIDSSDAVFTSLRVWRDLNQDGVSQANELSTLVASHIVSIGVSATPFWSDLGNGNVLTDIGSFKRNDGTSGLSGNTTHIAVNLELLINSFARSFNTAIPLSEQAKSLHEIGGSGQVRDLREAVSLSPDLGNWVQSYNQQTTREAQLGMLDAYIEKWADTSALKSLKQQADALAGSGVQLTYDLAGMTAGSTEYTEFVRKLGIVERFMGFTYGGSSGLPRYTPLDESSGTVTVSLAPIQIANVELAYERFKGDIYESSLLTSRLQGYAALIDMTVIEGKAYLNFSRMETAFATAITANPQKGLVDLIEFVSAVGENRVMTWGWNASEFLAAQINKASSLSAFSEELSSWTVRFAAPADHNVLGSGRNDLIVGTSGDDNLSAWEGDDLLFGGAGADRIYSGSGNNTLDGGTGSDHLVGDEGNDLYLFGPGYGKDNVYDYGGTDVIRLGAGVTPASTHVWRDGSNLYVGVNNDADVATVQSWFDETVNRVETIEFADGTVWSTALLAAATFDGTAGPDSISGTDEANTLFGFAGDDWLSGAAGDDTLEGGAGLDHVDGGRGNDTYIYQLGDGQDIFGDDGGTDAIKLGAGITTANVHLWRDATSLHLDIGGTTDAIVVADWFGVVANQIESVGFDSGVTWDAATLAAATFDGTPAADFIMGTAENNTLNGFAGNDGLYGGGGADILDGGAGADDLYGDGGDDTYFFGRGSGADLIVESEGSDTIVFAAGLAATDLRLWRDTSSLHFSVNGSLDELTVQGWFDATSNRVESVRFSDGSIWTVDVFAAAPFAGTSGPDVLSGTTGGDTLFGFDGNDDLYGQAGDDVLDGGTGSDVLTGDAGNDTYQYGRGDGQDTIHDTDLTVGNRDRILLGADISVAEIALSRNASDLYVDISGTSDRITVSGWYDSIAGRVERLEFANGAVWDEAVLAAARFIGTEAADALSTGVGNDVLEGRGGNDTLTTDAGDDTLDGGTGNDTLDGGSGNDNYVFGQGYGQDTVTDADGVDAVKLGAGITPANVTLWRDTSNLYLGIANSADVLTVQGWFDLTTNRVESVQFAVGTVWDVATLAAAAFGGTSGADALYGTTGNDLMLGFGGDDSLNGDVGNDALNGGPGSDTLDGGAGDDVLTGGTGSDAIDGGIGNDRYLFARGDGQDTIHETDSTAGNLDTIALAAGIAVGDLALSRDASNLYLAINGTTDKITVSGWYDDAANRVERIEFADGTVWDAAVLAAAKLSGTEGPDYLSGSPGNDALEGRGGNDSLTTDAGDDTLDGGTGNDSLDGGAGNDSYVFGLGYGQDAISDADGVDVIKLGAGIAPASVELWRDTSNLYLSITSSADLLTVQGWFDLATNRVESVQFADGTIWNAATLAAARIVGTSGMDYLSGTAGNDVLEGRGGDDTLAADTGDDTLDGGTGVDSMDGAAGNDSYLFDLGYGQDTITDAAGTDVIKLGTGLTTANMQMWRDTSNLYLGVTNGTDVLTVQSWFDLTTNRVESVQFADGTIWNTAALAAAAFGGTPGPDAIYGTTGNDTLLSFGGDDSITGDAGNDTLDGGIGSDALDGGAGNDSYVFGLGYGQDSIIDASGTDVIKLGAGLTTANVQLWRDSSTLYLGITGSTDVVSVQGWFDATTNRVESVQFLDGTIWNATTLAAAAFGGTSGTDSIYGTTGNNTIYGFGGNDYLYADAGNDVLDGGMGDDMLDGGAGNDTYKFGRGYGSDTVAETSGTTDLIQFDANTAPTEVLVSRDASHLYLSILGTTDKLTVQNWYADAAYRVEQVSFTDGTNWTVTILNAKTTTVTEVADFYWGTTGNDSVNGLGGDDQLLGNEGNDALSGGAGNDVLNGGTGTDTLSGGMGDDSYVVDATADVVTENAGEGSDTVRTSVTYTLVANLERLELLEAGGAINGTGNGLANTLVGNTVNNTLNGGVGADTLVGGVGNDTYVVDDAADITTENLNEGTDLVNASLSWTLSANVEKLTLTGTGAINGTGNELANTLTGNSAANVLTGGAGNDALNGAAGADTLIGGLGNDSYTVDNAADTTTENLSEGTDTVSANLSWTLGANLENLTLTGSTLINATGNDLNNVLTGNSAANVLTGGLGNDTLKGLAGNDQYVFGRGMGADLVQENDATAGNTDLLQFLSGVAIEQVWLRKVSNDLEVSIIGTTDKVTFTNWFLNSQYHVEQFKTSDGKTLADTDVQNLVTAMAGYAPPDLGQVTLPTDYWTALSSVITGNWH